MTEKDLENAKLNHIKQNMELYRDNKDIVSMYDDYIVKIVELFDFIMQKDSDLFYSIVFDILIEFGFFSAERKFNCNKNFKELLIKPGLSIINGNGECRNVSCFYEDVFKYFYSYPLKLCCFDANGVTNTDTLTYGNHMINLTLYHDTIYGFDIINHCIFKAKSDKILEGIDIDYTLLHKPNGDLLIGLTTLLSNNVNFTKEYHLIRTLLQNASIKSELSLEELKQLVKRANRFIIEKKEILQSFMIENEELTQEIKKKMLLLK